MKIIFKRWVRFNSNDELTGTRTLESSRVELSRERRQKETDSSRTRDGLRKTRKLGEKQMEQVELSPMF